MKAAATREKPLSTAFPDEPASAPHAEAPPPPKLRKVRYTLDLDPVQHKQLKRFALEADTDASAVMRALLVLLDTDTQVSSAVLTALLKD
jgi:hypothetical protein